MSTLHHTITNEQRRTRRVRAKTRGTTERPRLTVHRSNEHMGLQVINDETGRTLAAVSDLGKGMRTKGTKTERAKVIATELAKQLAALKITKLVFDRGSRRYHGRIKAVAETMREHGVQV